MSPQKFNDFNYGQGLPQNMHGGQQISNPYTVNSNTYPMNSNTNYASNYHLMSQSQPGGYYMQPGGMMTGYNNMYPTHNMYPQQYMRPNVQMKSNSSNLPMKQNSLSTKNIGFTSVTTKMVPSDPNSFNHGISMIHGAPGYAKYPGGMEFKMTEVPKQKQMSHPVVMNNFNTFVPLNQQPLSDQNAIKITSASLPMQSSLMARDTPGMATPSPMTQSNPESKKSTNAAKKAKNKGKKGENRNRERWTGRLKFFDESKNYGFLVVDQPQKEDEKDIFVHYDDLKKTNIEKNILSSSKNKYSIRFSFHVFGYNGKSKSSKKAVDLKLLSIHKLDPIDGSETAEPVLLKNELHSDY